MHFSAANDGGAIGIFIHMKRSPPPSFIFEKRNNSHEKNLTISNGKQCEQRLFTQILTRESSSQLSCAVFVNI